MRITITGERIGDREYRRINVKLSRDDGATWRTLSPQASFEVRRHSPTGFEWGYQGSGPAQLALAILLEVVGMPRAEAHYQCFKRQHVARWDVSGFTITSAEIEHWLCTHACK